MPIDPQGLDFDLVRKVVDKPQRTAFVDFDIYWNGVKRGTFTLSLDAKDQSKATTDFAYSLNYIPAA